MMATVEPKFSVLQMRCHVCRAVKTEVSSSSPEALAAARQAHKRARVFAMIAVGELVAMSVFALTASAVAAMR